MRNMLLGILAKFNLKEPSTWLGAGFMSVLAVFNLDIDPTMQVGVANILGGVSALLGIFLREGKK